MKAIVQNEYGQAEDVLRLEETATPDVGDDEVLVNVHAAGVDRGTLHIMTGLPYPVRVAGFGLRTPKYLNPGRSLAGTVHAVGRSRHHLAPGRRGVRHRRRCVRRIRLRKRSTSSHPSRRTSHSNKPPPSPSPHSPRSRPCAIEDMSSRGRRC